MGHNIIGNSGHVVVESSDVHIASNSTLPPAVTAALQDIAREIRASGDAAADAVLDAFNTELAKPAPSKSTLQSIWSGLVKILPDAAKLAESIKAVSFFLF